MRLLMPRLALTAIILSTAAAYADHADQLFKLLPDDGAAYHYFGLSVAISGTNAIVGSPQDDENGGRAGSAYLFDTATGDLITKILPDDGAFADADEFGSAVAISGSIAIVGAPYATYTGDADGAAYLFDVGTGQQIARIHGHDGGFFEGFGFSVAISGATAIVGAPEEDLDGPERMGAAFLFNVTTGEQTAVLFADDGADRDGFGLSVAISGDTAIVGAWADDDNGNASGSAYLFDANTGAQIAKLLPDDGAANDNFGATVAISGTTAVVGAVANDDNGSAYLFDTVTGLQIGKLRADDGAAGARFGWSVAISGATAIVSTPYYSNGSAYLFDTGTGEQIAKLLANDGAFADLLGMSVAIDGNTAIAGARYDDDNGEDSGSAYLFDATVTACPGDLDRNHLVELVDLAILLANFGTPSGATPADGDLTGDGAVTLDDLAILLTNFGTICE